MHIHVVHTSFKIPSANKRILKNSCSVVNCEFSGGGGVKKKLNSNILENFVQGKKLTSEIIKQIEKISITRTVRLEWLYPL